MATNYSVLAAFLLGSAAASPAAGETPAPPPATAAILEWNAKAKQQNDLIIQANAAAAAKKWQEAADTLAKLIALNPRWNYFQSLGNAQLSLGQFKDALDTYDKGIAGALADKTAPGDQIKAARAQMLTSKGNSLLKLKRNAEAIAAFTSAAELSTNPGVAYFNVCVTQYNIGYMPGAVASCDKAIKSDPTKADAYFVKGSVLVANAVLDKENHYAVPPGTLEALKKYLELAPKGSHAADVQAMLDTLKAAR
ncbi:MAG: tetratricopeptide repeat protein [Rhodomicrobium sp.]